MERAHENIDELLEELQATFHRLRQSGIDEELFDVSSGFEALAPDRRGAPAPEGQVGSDAPARVARTPPGRP